tara:strand:- start:930 stop:1070 length:141 start_codon:yes stop_codon:yes gene_type:complete
MQIPFELTSVPIKIILYKINNTLSPNEFTIEHVMINAILAKAVSNF